MTRRSRRLRILAATAVVLFAPAASATGNLAPSAAPRSNVAGLTSTRFVNAFVRRQGSELTIAGRRFRFAGANAEFLGLRNYGPIPSAGQGIGRERYASSFEIDDELATAHEMGATVVRAQTVGDTVGCSLCLEPSLGRFNPAAFHEIDLVVAAAHRYGIKLIGEFAGDANGSAPLGPPGLIKGLDQSTDWYCRWRHITAADCPTATFADPRVLRDYERHMKAVLDHVNPYTGLAYKNDPIFAGWVDGNNLGLLNPTTLPGFRSWLTHVAAAFKSIDHRQLFIDNSVYGGDYLPPTYSGGLNPDFGPVPPRSVIDIRGVDMFAQEWYPKDFAALDPNSPAATQLHRNAQAIAADGKTYAVIEYGWDHYNYTTQSLLRRFLAGITRDRAVSGQLFWALIAHARGHGWQPIPVDLHCKPTCQGFEDDGNWWAMYYTGRTTASNTAADMAARAQILRSAAYAIDGFAHPPAHERPPAPVITSTKAGHVVFQGSAGARDYSVQRLAHGHWTTPCGHCTTDNDDGWQDPTHHAGCYRVLAYNLSGVASPGSTPAGRGCAASKLGRRALAPVSGPAHWVAAWSASAADPGVLGPGIPFFASAGGRTVRDVVRISLGGSRLRIHLSNRFGSRTVRVQDVRVAVSAGGAAVAPATSVRVRFAGHLAVSLSAGRQLTSDPVAMAVRAGQTLAISVYVSGPGGRATTSGSLFETNYVSDPGDVAGTARANAFPSTTNSWFWVSGIDVLTSRRRAGAIVALGDSITAGYASTRDANRDWVDLLADRLRRAASHPQLSMLNAGIAGNNLHESSPCYGQSGLARLNRDALDQAGVRDVIVDEGVNDITHPHEPPTAPLFQCLAHRAISATGMIALFKLAIHRIHARHLRALGVTLSPFGRYAYWSPAIEAEREAINHWIRTSHAFDGVIDFDRVLRDPVHPAWLTPAFDSGDGLHPNDAGHAAMARAIPLSLFAG